MAKRGRPYQFRIDDRRQTVWYFLKQGLTSREIARKLKTRIEVIDRDMEAISMDITTWKEADFAGIEYVTYRDRKKEAEEAERKRLLDIMKTGLQVLKDFEKIHDQVVKARRPQKVITRGPRRSNKRVNQRRAVVLELQYRGIRQREIALMLNTPLRTIQGDYASLRKRPYEIWKAVELTRRQRLSVFTNEEMIEAFLGSPERKQELWERPQDEAVRFDLKWVRRRK